MSAARSAARTLPCAGSHRGPRAGLSHTSNARSAVAGSSHDGFRAKPACAHDRRSMLPATCHVAPHRRIAFPSSSRRTPAFAGASRQVFFATSPNPFSCPAGRCATIKWRAKLSTRPVGAKSSRSLLIERPRKVPQARSVRTPIATCGSWREHQPMPAFVLRRTLGAIQAAATPHQVHRPLAPRRAIEGDGPSGGACAASESASGGETGIKRAARCLQWLLGLHTPRRILQDRRTDGPLDQGAAPAPPTQYWRHGQKASPTSRGDQHEGRAAGRRQTLTYVFPGGGGGRVRILERGHLAP